MIYKILVCLQCETFADDKFVMSRLEVKVAIERVEKIVGKEENRLNAFSAFFMIFQKAIVFRLINPFLHIYSF